MANKIFVSINGDITETVKGMQYPKNALIFSPIEKSPKDYRKLKESAYEEIAASLEKMLDRIGK